MRFEFTYRGETIFEFTGTIAEFNALMDKIDLNQRLRELTFRKAIL